MTLTSAAKLSGLNVDAVKGRLRRGWTLDEALTVASNAWRISGRKKASLIRLRARKTEQMKLQLEKPNATK